MRRRWWGGWLAALATLSGCSSVEYYRQSVTGHLGLLARRTPVAELVADETIDSALRARLARVAEMREFATRVLALPDNRSYRDYVDVRRPYVVWNVVVAPELSLEPERWCFAVVGCITYRGYYDEARARGFADEWRARGYDVAVGGVRAYSTLGWLPDPLLSTMLIGPETYVASILFHELAHQVVYVRDDTGFNEAFAVAVEREGVRRWVRAHGDDAMLAQYERRQVRDEEFLALVLSARDDLKEVYAGPGSDADKRAAKAARLVRLREDHAVLRARWDGDPGYDAWFAQDLNNAKLALVATYHAKVPAFMRLLEENDGDFARFFAEVERLGQLPRAARDAELERLTGVRTSASVSGGA